MKALFSVVAMLILIFDAGTALDGASQGLNLCIRSVIPSLFPFFFLSSVLTTSLLHSSFPLLRPIGRLCGIPVGMESILIPAFLGGYPVGAQCISQQHQSGVLRKRDAHRLLAFCSNAGPSFLFGIIAPQFPSISAGWALWFIHILSAMLVGIFLPGRNTDTNPLPKSSVSQQSALWQSMRAMAQVCGWVMLFRVVIVFLERWIFPFLPLELSILLSGLLELTNGCIALSQIPSVSLRFVIASVLLSLGGLCVTMQTASVTGGLGLGSYIPGKLLQAGFSLVLSILLVQKSIPLFLGAAIVLVIVYFRKNRGRNFVPLGV